MISNHQDYNITFNDKEVRCEVKETEWKKWLHKNQEPYKNEELAMP